MSKPHEDISPASLPFTNAQATPEARAAAVRVCESVDLAKRMLLELRVRDFTAGDVVALAALIEARGARQA